MRKNQWYGFAAHQSALYNVARWFVVLLHESPEASPSVFACRLHGWQFVLVVRIQVSRFNRGMINHIYTRCLLRVLLVDCAAGCAVVSDVDPSVVSLDEKPNACVRGLRSGPCSAGA